MLNEQQIRQFRQQGFVLGSRVLSDEQIARLQAETLRVIDERERDDRPQPVLCHNMGRPDAPVWQIVNIWMASAPFAEMIRHPLITQEMAQLIPDAQTLRIWHDQIQYKPAGQGGVNMWHQDSPYWGILTPKHEQVTAWIALDDADETNGCMSMVPQSHDWGNAITFLHTLKSFDEMDRTESFDGHPVRVVRCPVKKGHVHYHHSLTWHGSPANKSERPRRALALHYMTQNTRNLADGAHVMKRFVHVGPGELVSGDAFPVVWGNA
jgi:ectoine hydroxylase-related dioxygenase (phytanoyl-CoA dioxygenase family)